jgi:hypothetical protein
MLGGPVALRMVVEEGPEEDLENDLEEGLEEALRTGWRNDRLTIEGAASRPARSP